MRIWTVVKHLIQVRGVEFLSADIADAIARCRVLQREVISWKLGQVWQAGHSSRSDETRREHTQLSAADA